MSMPIIICITDKEMIAVFIALLIIVALIVFQKRQEVVIVKKTVTVPVPVTSSPPPYKTYKPPQYQQMGLLIKESDVLPLYGRQTRAYRDNYNYYTTTPGEQAYSLPIYYKDRDCTEDIGCQELYGGEDVTITGREGAYTTTIYRTDVM